MYLNKVILSGIAIKCVDIISKRTGKRVVYLIIRNYDLSLKRYIFLAVVIPKILHDFVVDAFRKSSYVFIEGKLFNTSVFNDEEVEKEPNISKRRFIIFAHYVAFDNGRFSSDKILTKETGIRKII